jgi:hypothetical protein
MNAIRRGLAANLRVIENCTVSIWVQESVTLDALSVVGLETAAYEEGAFGEIASDGGARLAFVIEGAASLAGGLRAAQERFDDWILWQVPEAVESDVRLTSRLNDDGSIDEDQEPACDALAVREFRGYRRMRLGNSQDDHLVGDWVVDILV